MKSLSSSTSLSNMKALQFPSPNSPQPIINILKQQSSSSSTTRTTQTHFSFRQKRQSLVITSSDGSSNSNTSNDDVPRSPPDVVEVRFRRGSRKRLRQRGEEGFGDSKQQVKGVSDTAVPKKWEEMTVMEKAMELYVGEKGLLFWLNKFAYASIFIVIGGWILFRFVGPSLNLYQLDTPPLSPSNILKGE